MIKFKQKENINTKTGTPNLLGKSFSHPRLFTRKEATSFIDAGSHFRVIQSSSQVAGSNELSMFALLIFFFFFFNFISINISIKQSK